MQKFRKKIARLRFFATRSGPSLALILALWACKPVQEAEVPTHSVADQELDAAFEKGVLVIEASAYACYRFDVYVATSREQQARGLMAVRKIPAMTGMLFIYDFVATHSMWMKNTLIPLDMVFARQDGTVSSVVHDTEPHSLQSIASIEPVAYVLELNAGTAAKLFIDENSRLIWESANRDDE